ncbi:wall-associated receptor kinase 5-like [Zingiber officinale]|uniref:wall-associated receptor kinase 5-like n=1 Tax=Zingiber officinale TaxID=94328 RepID=UPI001C4B3AD9|nr:wall-associated receptor kinase 5-like [Zingiber officinale]
MTQQSSAEFIVRGRSWLLVHYEMVLLSLFLFQWLLPSSSSTHIGYSALFGGSNCSNAPYPFEISNENPSLSKSLPGLQLCCNQSCNNSLKVLIGGSFIDVMEISLEEGYLSVLVDHAIKFGCSRISDRSPKGNLLDLRGTPYTFHTRNKFTVLGCDAMATVRDSFSGNIVSGCVAFCVSYADEQHGQSHCSGVGCCRDAIPPRLQYATVELSSIRKLTESMENITMVSGGCNEAFLMDGNDSFIPVLNTRRPIVLDWSIGNKSCEDVTSSHICGPNASCYNSSDGLGYRCKCQAGYEGNPYLQEGCQDIDECKDHSHNCSGKCVNIPGDYNCTCPLGTKGDGKKDGVGCKRDTYIEIGLGTSLALLVILLTTGFWIFCELKKRKQSKLKLKHFLQNGGLLLRQYVSENQFFARIFTIEELERATDNFNEKNVVGRGGYGTVYRGTVLPDGEVVAIKKSKFVDETQIEQFINEVVILSKITHRNVVKLLGCCLETDVPLLVYEFISNGTLSQHLHEQRMPTSGRLSWETRLRIATETAGALAFLHCKAASVPIVHRDVKSANILLDENCTAKVSDFGASRLIPMNQTHVTTLVQGTIGYLDPEYFQTCQLTEKSDVYSFGVVLLELLTSEKPVLFCRMGTERNLASHFMEYMAEKGGRAGVSEFLDRQLVWEARTALPVLAVAQLARRCLNLNGEDRPTMTEVAVELSALRRLAMQSEEWRDRRISMSPRRLAAVDESMFNEEDRLLP